MTSLAYGNTRTCWLSPLTSSDWVGSTPSLLGSLRLPCFLVGLGFPPAGTGSMQSTRLRASSSTVVAPWKISATLRRLSQKGVRAWRVA